MKVRRRRVTDAITRDGETAVLVDGVVILLSELSSAIYALCERPTEVTALARDLESVFGSPEVGSALDATHRAIGEMVRHGILTTDGDGSAATSQAP